MKYILAFAILCSGCSEYHEELQPAFTKNGERLQLLVLVDMSMSFDQKMAEGGVAYNFLLSAVDKFFRNSVGGDNEIIIGQLSANRKVLIWQGTPQDLRASFPSPGDFAAFLHQHSNPAASPIHAGICTAIEYLLSEKTKSCLCVLSDMDDNDPKAPEMKQRVLDDLGAFGRSDGSVGIYFCIDNYLVTWRRILQEAAIKQFCVEGDFTGTPVLPTFGD